MKLRKLERSLTVSLAALAGFCVASNNAGNSNQGGKKK